MLEAMSLHMPRKKKGSCDYYSANNFIFQTVLVCNFT